MTHRTSATETVIHYHDATKHHLERYAAGPDTLDWDEQPEAFRWFDGAEKIDLPLVAETVPTPYNTLYRPEEIAAQPFTITSIGCFLELALGLSAWKQYGEARWALRCNPSSGNLHAEEAYIVCNSVDNLPAGVYHYLVRDHQLERRCRFDGDVLDNSTLLLGLSSIQWREAWKYGERAYRYCQLDTGHAIAAVRYAAAVLGWRAELVDQAGDAQLNTLLGLNRQTDYLGAEGEHPDVLLQISAKVADVSLDLIPLVDAAKQAVWHGRANLLSRRHLYRWPVIDEVSSAAEKPITKPVPVSKHSFPNPIDSPCKKPAATLIRERRSAQAFDGQTHISSEAFFRILDMTLPRPGYAPWDCTPWRDSINLVLFVHRVTELKPGLYAFIRNPHTRKSFKEAICRAEFNWQPVTASPDHLALYNLVNANGQNLAATLSCHQSIAAQSCFSLAMIADCTPINDAPWHYRRLYWEAGMIGQVLYLEAEAAGVQGTGIGCYFDDAVHDMLGIKDSNWQSLYHFTVGRGLIDSRIQTIPPYAHLERPVVQLQTAG